MRGLKEKDEEKEWKELKKEKSVENSWDSQHGNSKRSILEDEDYI